MDIERTATRVEASTDDMVNARIRRQIEANVAYFARRIHQIDQRLHELDHEWDVERTLETNAAIISIFGLGLGLFRRRALLLPVIVASFLLQHALQGWCPPVPIFRRLGIRTMREINEERYALKALRGDFEGLQNGDPHGDSMDKAEKALSAAELH